MHDSHSPLVRTSGHALSWMEVARIAAGEPLSLSEETRERIRASRRIVEEIVEQGIRAYGVNTGVGALCDVIVGRPQQQQLSRNLVFSTAVGVGPLHGPVEVRAIMAAAVNNFAHGYSGVRLDVVEHLVALLNGDCVPEVPSKGSVGYLTHMAHIALLLIGEGWATVGGRRLPGADALAALGLKPLVLEAKEGLSLINGTPCAAGLSVIALSRVMRLLDWCDAAGAMAFEALRGQCAAFAAPSMGLRQSPGISRVAATLRSVLSDSGILAAVAGERTQDPLSLRSIPHVHGAARDAVESATLAVDRELASVTDNPIVMRDGVTPCVYSEANAVGAGIALALDQLGIVVATLAAMSERRTDRLVNPLVNRLPPFLTGEPGVGSGFMIAQYTSASLVADNRRLAAPASLDGGITSGLQEDYLCHGAPSAVKALQIIDNAECVVAIELLSAAQAYDFLPALPERATATDQLYRRIRQRVAHYRDDRVLAEDFGSIKALIQTESAWNGR